VTDEDFFEEPTEQSKVKTRIVSKYFKTWARVMIPSVRGHGNRIAYVDLFAGPGQYKDRTPSTPAIVLGTAVKDADMRNMLVTLLNDKDPENFASLTQVIGALPGIQQLKYQPEIRNEVVGTEIAKLFDQIRLVPTLLFVDPWGYKGLSLNLISSVLKDWGCDCIFFFNYNRVNPGLSNPVVDEHMRMLFGKQRAGRIREALAGLDAEQREALIVEELSDALHETGANYVLPFCFKNEHGTRTAHHLIFVTKHFRGYEIMKEIMSHESSEQDQGVGSFAYSAASKRFPTLFELTRPLDELEDMLLRDFAGKTLSMEQVYLTHNVGKPYIEANYKTALTKLEAAEKITADPPAAKRPTRQGKTTFAGHVTVTFPRRDD
jgi:three-Cys-motif partner protein